MDTTEETRNSWKIKDIDMFIEQIDAEIDDLETNKRILESYRSQLKYPLLIRTNWTVEAENILKRS